MHFHQDANKKGIKEAQNPCARWKRSQKISLSLNLLCCAASSAKIALFYKGKERAKWQTDRHCSSQEQKEGQRQWWRMTECVLSNSTIRADLYFLFRDVGTSCLAMHRLKPYLGYVFIMCVTLILQFPIVHQVKWATTPENPGWFSPLFLVPQQPSWTAAMPPKHGFCSCSLTQLQVFLCLCGCFLLTLLVFLLSYSSSLDPRQTEGAPLHRGTPTPLFLSPSLASPLCWWLDSRELVTWEWKEQDVERKALICFMFHSQTESWNFRGLVLK